MFNVQDQPDPSRDFHRLLNLPPAAGLEVFNDTPLASGQPETYSSTTFQCSV